MSTRQWRDRIPATPSNTERLKDDLTKLTKGAPPTPEAQRSVETKIEMAAEISISGVIDEFTAAGFNVKRISDGRKQPRGITMDEWKCREAQRQCAQYLGALAKLPKNIKPRAQGETAIFYRDGYAYEWNHSAKGFTETSSRGSRTYWPISRRRGTRRARHRSARTGS